MYVTCNSNISQPEMVWYLPLKLSVTTAETGLIINIFCRISTYITPQLLMMNVNYIEEKKIISNYIILMIRKRKVKSWLIWFVNFSINSSIYFEREDTSLFENIKYNFILKYNSEVICYDVMKQIACNESHWSIWTLSNFF